MNEDGLLARVLLDDAGMRRTFSLLAAFALVVTAMSCATRRESPPVTAAVKAPPKPSPSLEAPLRFSATAYAIDGTTAAGTRARRGIVAADPKVIPLGSRIRVSNAGRYSGEYLVEDTGPAIKGREIDIKVGTAAEARKFGRKSVLVEVLRRGPADAEASAD